MLKLNDLFFIDKKHVESLKDWTFHTYLTVTSKFVGQKIELQPYGTYHLKFAKTSHHYTWSKVKTVVNNIVFGKMWLNHTGDVDVVNKTTNDVCHLNFASYSKFSQTPPNKINGIVKDSNGIAKYVIDGVCSEKFFYASVKEPKIVVSIEDYKHLIKGMWELLWKRENGP